MGCASSKHRRCRHCRSQNSAVPRSYSMHVHHPPQHTGDSYHVVALTSTSLGSLKLEISDQNNHRNDDLIAGGDDCKNIVNGGEEKEKRGFSVGLVEAKTWSNMIGEKIPKTFPKTPIRTPPGEPEMINTWELMEGLDDTSPLRPAHHYRSFSFNVVNSPSQIFPNRKSDVDSLKPTWHQISDKDFKPVSEISEFDQEMISSFRKSLEELSPDNPFHLTRSEKVIVYFTSLRGVRKTYEDCCHVRVILKSLGMRVDERDVSMHSGFKEELREQLGEGFGGGLPRVFMGNKYIGGADEIRRLHEEEQLEKLLEGCEMADDNGGDGGGVCEACGDIRFVPCETCSGSCKIYCENEETESEENEHNGQDEESEYGFQRCPDCNENGLIRCPICCY